MPHSLSPWFDDECKKLKKERCSSLNKFRKCKDRKNLKRYHEIRNLYQTTCNQKRNEYHKQKQFELESSIHDSKRFWSVLKTLNRKPNQNNNITTEDWYQHFKDLFSPVLNITTDNRTRQTLT